MEKKVWLAIALRRVEKKNHNAEIYNAQIDHNKLVLLDASTPAKLHK